MRSSLIYCIAVIIALIGCTTKNFTSLSVEDFKTTISDTTVQLLDVRTFEEYSESHILNAHFLDLSDSLFTDKVDSVLNIEYPVAVYCRTGRRSKEAAELLTQKGFKVYELDGGITDWKQANLPLITED